MSDDEYGRVPAGWYPDPLGLPQLRWWDNHSWTEHVSDARQPMMPTPTAAPTMFADDEALTRRARRSTESSTVDGDAPDTQPSAETLRQLAPPPTAEVPQLVDPGVTAAPAFAAASDAPPASAVTNPADAFAAAAFADLAAESARAAAQQPNESWLPMSNPSAPIASAFTPAWSESPVSATDPGRRGTHQVLGTTAPHLQTIEVWAIALLPMLQLLLSLLVVATFSTGPSVAFMAAIWLGPIPIIMALALLDARTLRRRGIDRVASGWWATLGAPVYLVVRAVGLSRISGAGYGPVGVALLLTGLVGASILAVPGLIIAAFPTVFAAEASNSIELNARSIGAAMEVSCPATPPLFIGQQLRCPAENTSGENLVVTVSLQRSNGWIAWQVDDWGIFSVVR